MAAGSAVVKCVLRFAASCCLMLLWLQVSLSVRLAVGVTSAQAAAGTDEALADWLSQPRNIRNAIAASGMGDPFGPNALVKWLQLPEIWVQRVRESCNLQNTSPVSSAHSQQSCMFWQLQHLCSRGCHASCSAAESLIMPGGGLIGG